MDSSPGFGSATTDCGNKLPRPCQTRFPFASPNYQVRLACDRKSLAHYAKGTRSRPRRTLPPFVCMRFQVSFTPLPGVFSPFPHGTSSLSVGYEYLALEDGPPIFRQDYACPVLLLACPPTHLSHTGLSPSMAVLSRTFY